MKPLKLFMNTVPGELPENSYPFGKNGIQFDLQGTSFNEPGFKKMAASVPYTFIGVIETDNKPVLMATNNTDSAIGFFNPDTELYEPIVDDRAGFLINWPNNGEKLGFTLEHYIIGEAQRNYKGELVIAFTDKDKFPKYLNCDNPNILRLDDLRLFPYYIPPKIVLDESIGGSLEPGAYYISVGYERNDGTSTPYTEVSDVIIIRPGNAGSATDKAILISLTNLDVTYNFIRVAVISKIQGQISAVEITDWTPFVGGTAEILYTGDNLTSPITVQEILTPPSAYERVGTIGQLNDALYIGNLEKEVELTTDLQKYVTMAQIRWKSELIDAISPPIEHVQGKKRGFMHEEVYALYIRFHKVRGGFTKAFHKPGPPLLAPFIGNSTESVIGGYATAVPKYKVEDCIPAFDAIGKTGSPGAWLNSSETYPNESEFNSTSLGGPNLMGTQVRHHKMPSLRWCKNNLYSSVPDYGKTKLDILTLEITSLTLPPGYADLIDGYELLYAKRVGGNMTVFGQGALLHGAVPATQVGVPTGNADIYTTGGNWTSSVTHMGKGDYNDDWELTQLRLDTMRIHPFDILFNKPTITPTFISAQYRMRKEGLKTEGYLEDGAHEDAHNMPTVHLVDYTRGNNPTSIPVGSQLRNVKDSFYLAIGISINRFTNTRHENAFAGTLGGTNWPLNSGNMSYRIRGTSYTESALISDYEETYMVNLIALKEDLYVSFYGQRLVSAGSYKLLADFSAFTAGDTFVCDYTFHTYGRHDQIDTQGEGFKGKKVIRRVVCESASNIHLRYELPANIYSKWYPRNSIAYNNPDQCYITPYDRSIDPNQFGYTKDFNALNDFISSTIFNPFSEEITVFPYRIHRGGKLSRQNKARSWRTFLPLDYYECQKNMGVIINLAGMYDRLIIHHENAMFYTQDKAQLESGLLSITLGSGDIFKFEPQEGLPSKLGYAGTIHDIACIKTPIGYLSVDGKQGEIYLWSGERPRNIGEGLNNFFRDFLKVNETNVYIGNGITLGYDQKYKRLIVTVKKKVPASGLTVKIFEDTDEFFDALVEGDIVYYYGRYIIYRGINVPLESGFDCLPDDADPDMFAWEVDTFVCEEDGLVLSEAAIAGGFASMSSPGRLLYDTPNEYMYVGDHDNTLGNFYRINLTTAAKTYYGTPVVIYSLVTDVLNRRIFGSSLTNGLQVFDVDTLVVSTINYGTNTALSRTGLWIVGNNIVARDIVAGTLTLIDRSTLNIVATLTIATDIPSGATYLIDTFDLLEVGGNIWVIPYGRDGTGNIAVYSGDLLTLVTSFSLVSAAPVSSWGSGDFYQKAFYDNVYGKVYIHDVGSANTYVLNSTSYAIINTLSWTAIAGEFSILMEFFLDPTNNELYFYRKGVAIDGTTVVDQRVYTIGRDLNTIVTEFLATEIPGELVREGVTEYMWTAIPGLKTWEGGAWATDGEIKRYLHGAPYTPP